MHTEDAVQVTTGQTGHGSDLRTIALWTSTDNGANWTYEGVALSIDSDYAVPGNLQVSLDIKGQKELPPIRIHGFILTLVQKKPLIRYG